MKHVWIAHNNECNFHLSFVKERKGRRDEKKKRSNFDSFPPNEILVETGVCSIKAHEKAA